MSSITWISALARQTDPRGPQSRRNLTVREGTSSTSLTVSTRSPTLWHSLYLPAVAKTHNRRQHATRALRGWHRHRRALVSGWHAHLVRDTTRPRWSTVLAPMLAGTSTASGRVRDNERALPVTVVCQSCTRQRRAHAVMVPRRGLPTCDEKPTEILLRTATRALYYDANRKVKGNERTRTNSADGTRAARARHSVIGRTTAAPPCGPRNPAAARGSSRGRTRL